jgi:uncharacterized membrane protein YfcA
LTRAGTTLHYYRAMYTAAPLGSPGALEGATMEAIGLALALAIGLTLGLLGGGGSILTVPVFVYVLGFGAKTAVAMSLPVVGTTSLVGAIGHWRAGNVNLRVALAFGVVAMAGAYVGAKLAAFVSGTAQLSLLAVAMLAASASMFRRSLRPEAQADAAGGRDGGSRPGRPALVAITGLGVGLLTGLVGIGGGFLIVPALVLLARAPIREAVGTSLLVIAMNAAAGSLGYLGHVDVPWRYAALFTTVAILGILAGTHLIRFVSQQGLQRAFALFLLVMGALVLYQNRGVLSQPRQIAAERRP